jgi:predicted HicB family RNase H-like nuclease
MTKYKGYVGQFTVDTETGLIRGEVINTRDVITFYGATVPEAEQAFRDSVDDYLDFCKEQGDEPEKPYSGKLLIRLAPELHQELDILAKSRGKSVNKLISGCLARMARRHRGDYAPLAWGKAAKQKTPSKAPSKAPR